MKRAGFNLHAIIAFQNGSQREKQQVHPATGQQKKKKTKQKKNSICDSVEWTSSDLFKPREKYLSYKTGQVVWVHHCVCSMNVQTSVCLRSTDASLIKDVIFPVGRFNKMLKSTNAQREDENHIAWAQHRQVPAPGNANSSKHLIDWVIDQAKAGLRAGLLIKPSTQHANVSLRHVKWCNYHWTTITSLEMGDECFTASRYNR